MPTNFEITLTSIFTIILSYNSLFLLKKKNLYIKKQQVQFIFVKLLKQENSQTENNDAL